MQRRIIRIVMRLAQFINRRVLASDRIRTLIPFREFLFNVLTPPLNDSEKSVFREKLRTDIITKQVEALLASGKTAIDFYILLHMSMGDIMACEPMTRYLKKMAPKCRIHWLLLPHYRGAVETNPLIDEIIEIGSLSEGKDICSKMKSVTGNVVVDCIFDETTCAVTQRKFRNNNNPQINLNTYYSIGNLLETFCLAAGLPMLNDSPIYNISGVSPLDCLPQNDYIVIHCHSSTRSRDWPESKWTELVVWLIAKGFSVVEIGIERGVKVSIPGYVDCTGVKKIQSLVATINEACVFIGGDSCFAHAANCCQVPSVIMLGKLFIYDDYFPYSGFFARSEMFNIVRAPKGHFVKDITVDEVKAAVDFVLGRE